MICIVNTGLGFACYFKAMEETSAQETSLVFFLKPVLAPVFAFFILGEVISWNMGARNRFHPNWLAISTAARSAGGAKTSKNAWGINQKKPFQFN